MQQLNVELTNYIGDFGMFLIMIFALEVGIVALCMLYFWQLKFGNKLSVVGTNVN